jgi:hypothetical protein
MEINKEDFTNIMLALQELDKRVQKLESDFTSTGVVTSGVPRFVQEFLEKKKEEHK